jgi:hypothetical protein
MTEELLCSTATLATARRPEKRSDRKRCAVVVPAFYRLTLRRHGRARNRKNLPHVTAITCQQHKAVFNMNTTRRQCGTL